ncbi:twin-arginine translocation signal domain-containing protein, partial [Micromonospora sp. STR1s_5]|nr:twin-arginine translocation signal domain-containing protein [Micromonospora sp. STR1s_5]
MPSLDRRRFLRDAAATTALVSAGRPSPPASP